MKTIITKTVSALLFSAALFSFTAKPGGEGFEVYLNNKLILQRFGNQLNTPQVLQFTEGFTASDELTIKYHHCGQVGKNRALTVKNEENKVLKVIRFADSETPVSGMSCKVKDIISLKKGNSRLLKLYYTSSEIPGGRLLASIVTRSSAVAATP